MTIGNRHAFLQAMGLLTQLHQTTMPSAMPKTIDEMLNLSGALAQTCGGTGDPGTFSVTIPCPFNDTMTDTLKTPYNETVRAVFYYCFVELDLIEKAKDSDRFLLHFRGTYEVQGRF